MGSLRSGNSLRKPRHTGRLRLLLEATVRLIVARRALVDGRNIRLTKRMLVHISLGVLRIWSGRTAILYMMVKRCHRAGWIHAEELDLIGQGSDIMLQISY